MVTPSLYFRHGTRTIGNVRLAWHNVPAVPRVGDQIRGPFGEWVVTHVIWTASNSDICELACIDVHVRDRVPSDPQ